MRLPLALLALPLLAISQPAMADRDQRRLDRIEEKLEDITPEHFQETASISGDDLDTLVTITTQDGFKHRGGFSDRFRTDSFIRAFVSRETGEASFQIYATISYSRDWRHYNRVNFATANGPQSADLDRIGTDTNCEYSVCVLTEIVGFTVDEDTLRAIAEDGSGPWRFRFYARSGDDWTELMSRAELAGALAAVDAYRDGLQIK
ncbi:MAG: hypothetical protein AAF697_14135 [Pseudomonadota bacterium]